jgi:hypothetical protein
MCEPNLRPCVCSLHIKRLCPNLLRQLDKYYLFCSSVPGMVIFTISVNDNIVTLYKTKHLFSLSPYPAYREFPFPSLNLSGFRAFDIPNIAVKMEFWTQKYFNFWLLYFPVKIHGLYCHPLGHFEFCCKGGFVA